MRNERPPARSIIGAGNVTERTPLEILLSYCLERDADPSLLEAALGRVERYYSVVASEPLVCRGAYGARGGVVVWDAQGPWCQWPRWAEDATLGVATAGVPIGWGRVCRVADPRVAPLHLAHHLLDDPGRLADLDPPFALAILDRDAALITLINDGLGLMQMFEMRFEGGWVWSNRLGALPLFAGTQPVADPRAWSLFAGTGWFMADSAPIRGTTILPPGSVRSFSLDGQEPPTRRQEPALERWVRPRAPDVVPDTIDQDLASAVREAVLAFPDRPRAGLSGGRDSRLVAAAAIAGGSEVQFHTNATLPGEIEAVRELLRLLDREIRHQVTEIGDVSETGTLRERTLTWHRAHDGIRCEPRFPTTRRDRFPTKALISGLGGEIAHGHYYLPRDRIEAASTLQGLNDLLAKRLLGNWKIFRPHVREEAVGVIREKLAEGAALGIADLNLIDWFYLTERLRRWGGASTGTGAVSPLTTPSFIRAAFDLRPEERLDSALHKRLIARLIPAWADVPFYSKRPGDERLIRRPMLWETKDAEAVDELLASPRDWDDVFEPAGVASLWRSGLAERGREIHERLFHRIAARAYFEEHLRDLGRAAQVGPPLGRRPRASLLARLRRPGQWARSPSPSRQGAKRDLREPL